MSINLCYTDEMEQSEQHTMLAKIIRMQVSGIPSLGLTQSMCKNWINDYTVRILAILQTFDLYH